jgi:hypothetical protein
MLLDLPDWSTRHNYFHHSNPRSKDRAKNIYEKVHVRPKLNAAWKVIKTPGNSDAERDLAYATIETLSANRSSANMEAGRAVQYGCDLHLVPDEFGTTLSLSEAVHMAVKMMREYEPKNTSADARELDTNKRNKYAEELPATIENAVLGLKEAMARDNRILGEIELIKPIPGCAVPHNTRPDYGRRGDLKTKWCRVNEKAKHGWSPGALPRSLTGMFDMNNVFQAAGFWALNGHLPPFLVYANSSDYRVFDAENTPELRDDFLADVVNEITLYHKTTENILRAAKTKEELLGLVSPDWNAIYWKEPPAYLAEAKRVWGIN